MIWCDPLQRDLPENIVSLHAYFPIDERYWVVTHGAEIRYQLVHLCPEHAL